MGTTNIERTVENYDHMAFLMQYEEPEILYTYNVLHDEVNSAGFPAIYMSCDKQFIKLITQEA